MSRTTSPTFKQEDRHSFYLCGAEIPVPELSRVQKRREKEEAGGREREGDKV